jgi:hypothetical protein
MVTRRRFRAGCVALAACTFSLVVCAEPAPTAAAAPSATPAPSAAPTASATPAPSAAPDKSADSSEQKSEAAPPATPAVPKVHHAPVSVATAHEVLAIRADIEHPELVKRALVVYRTPGVPELKEVEFQRASSGPYVAEIPADDLRWPSLGYAIEIEPMTGSRIAAFASRSQLHEVEVPEDLMDIRERALDERLGHRRSVFSASGDYVSFGTSPGQNLNGQTQALNDHYYRLEAGYTYRPLRFVTEFGVRAGLVRGVAPVEVLSASQLGPGQSPEDRFNVGLNYGAPSVRIRLHDQVHLEGELLASVTEVGFSWGGGGSILLGDPYGSKLTLGFESIQVFGNRFYSRMDVVATDRIIVAPIIEVTDMPHADTYGVRLLGEVAIDLGQGFSVALRGGYQARRSTSGGAAGGGTLSYSF